MALRGARVYLDAVAQADLPAFATWFSDEAFLALLVPGTVMPAGLDGEEAWFRQQREAQAAGRVYTFAIRTVDGGRLIGSTGLHDISAKNRTAVFGIAIGDPAAQGRGLGAEATELVLRFGFDELGLHRIGVEAFAYNTRALALYRRLGFVDEGRRRDALYRDGRHHDIVAMAMLEDEFRARPRAGSAFIPDLSRGAPSTAARA